MEALFAAFGIDQAYAELSLAALLPVFASIVLYLFDKKTIFGKLPYWIKQLIYGVLFGLIAVVGTEKGIPMNGAQVNCRDAAVLTGGLLFGAPAGLIAGVIGGVERWIAVNWGIGVFTQVACSVSTILAGVYAALLRKFMFENKKPGWTLSLAIGIVVEVFHLTMVFITNMDQAEKAMAVVKACTLPMVLANGLSVMLATFAISVLSHEKREKLYTRARISQTIQRWLLLIVTLAFLVTSLFVFRLQDEMAMEQANSLLQLANEEIAADVEDHQAVNEQVLTSIKNRHVGQTGYVLILDQEYHIVGTPSGMEWPESLQQEWNFAGEVAENTTFEMTLQEEETYCQYRLVEDHYSLAVLPVTEALQFRNIALYVNSFMEILVFAILFALIYFLIKLVVVKQIKNINESLSRITGGDLGVVVNVRSNEEFASLSDDINAAVDTMKGYIAEASARIDQELEFAQNIQKSALPSKFPAFPKHTDFDIFASMNPAKEVGGDFYDFYMTDDNHLHFLIADVSGKGIPAAMFMMRAKTELKSLTETDLEIGDVFTRGNAALCEGNDAGMFVTAWQGGIDLETGLVKFANAGHNPPLVRHKNGKFEYLRSRVGFVLAGMEGVPYKAQDLQLEPGDCIYLYTDGVTEATNAQNELYGEERLLKAINAKEFANMEELCKHVKKDVDGFVGDAPQFDDITMVAMEYVGKPPVPTFHFEHATVDDIPVLTEQIEAELEKRDCPMKAVIQINVAIDEIFSNIVRYGYPKGPGPVTVKVVDKYDPRMVCIRFSDEGIPYNPLVQDDPDVTLSAEERGIGGLGIYMVKKSMDDVRYKYEDGQNVLTIFKKI